MIRWAVVQQIEDSELYVEQPMPPTDSLHLPTRSITPQTFTVLLGKSVSIRWDSKWYNGVVVKVSSAFRFDVALVLYDDGEQAWHPMDCEEWKLTSGGGSVTNRKRTRRE